MKTNKHLFLMVVTLSILLMPIASAADNIIINDFTANVTHGSAPLNVRFTANISGEVTKWKWEFYNPQINHWSYSGGSGNNVTTFHEFGRAKAYGVFNVSLIVVGPDGSDFLKKVDYITAYPPGSTPPVAAFSASPTSGNAPFAVTFTDQSTGSPTSWNWNLGDGTSKTSQNPIHIYSKAGKYTVSLIVTNIAGTNTKTIANYITVKTVSVKPVAAFTASSTSGKHPLNVKFTDKSTGLPISWSWNFGDKSTSTVKSPAHKYTKAGKYTVTLTVKNAAGSNTAKKTNYITVK